MGNLEERTDHNELLLGQAGVTEHSYYDELNRLLSVDLNGAAFRQFQYDNIGNITSHSVLGAYTYSQANNAGPHAVTSIGGQSLSYDLNGNMLTGRGRNLTYTQFNKPASISSGGTAVNFRYSPERMRYRQILTNAEGTTLTYYIGKLFERITKPTGVIEYKNYIYAAGILVAVNTRRSNATADTRYMHVDNLGSITAITNEQGTVVERFAYDPFGKRRAGTWDDGIIGQLFSNVSPRGYTGHENLDDVGLVHMNGRVYDPDIARFVSPDPVVPVQYNGQALNRYSYVLNNPLSMNDPTGHWPNWPHYGDVEDKFKEKVSPQVAGAILIVAGAFLYTTYPELAVAMISSGAYMIQHDEYYFEYRGSYDGDDEDEGSDDSDWFPSSNNDGSYQNSYFDMSSAQNVVDRYSNMFVSMVETSSEPAYGDSDGGVSPVGNAPVSSPFRAERTCEGCSPIHSGTDYAVPIGTEVHAIAPGRVVRANFSNGGYGNVVIIDHGRRGNGALSFYTLYAHGNSLSVSNGDMVSARQVIMLSGNTGVGTGAHLHYELILTNKKPWERGFYGNINERYPPAALANLLR